MKIVPYTSHQHKDKPRYTDLVVGEYPVAGEEVSVVEDEEDVLTGKLITRYFLLSINLSYNQPQRI